MKKILQRDEKVLHMVAVDVPVREITTPKIKKILKDKSYFKTPLDKKKIKFIVKKVKKTTFLHEINRQ